MLIFVFLKTATDSLIQRTGKETKRYRMATIKVKYRPSTQDGQEGKVYYQVIHNRVVRQISTDYRLYAPEWDNRCGTVLFPVCDTGRNPLLRSIRERINRDQARLEKIVTALGEKADGFTSDDIVGQFRNQWQEQSFFSFTRNVIAQLKRLGKIRTSETYMATLNSFTRFREQKDLFFDEIDADLIMEYEAYLKKHDISPNTSSFYMRNLRAVYNRAVDKDLTEQKQPFKHVYTGVDKTVKRSLPLHIIRQIKSLDLSFKPSLDFARDMFLFSFYTRGMSFVDMAYLRKKDLANGMLAYRRRKTDQQLFIKWEECMQEILDKYPDNTTEYLLPIIKAQGRDKRLQYMNALHFVNQKLKNISAMLDLSMPLTMYVARHSWANIAKSSNIPLAVISEGMGHDSETTTQIYLSSLDTSIVDRANAVILGKL